MKKNQVSKKQRRKRKFKTLVGVLCVAVIGLIAVSFWYNGGTLPTGKPRICIDAGHGGSDVGAEYEGRYEKDDNLRLALAVGEILEDNGIDVIYTRKKDVFVELEDRAKFANRRYATYFVSLHRNSAEGDVSGVEIWINNNALNNEAQFAENIIEKIDEVGFGKNRGVKRGYQGNPLSNYLVNSATDMPSCLVEMGFITTERDNELFDENLEKYAAAIAEGIMAGINTEE
jgi:N-acetylmuramoyl-L-alanine amidase